MSKGAYHTAVVSALFQTSLASWRHWKTIADGVWYTSIAGNLSSSASTPLWCDVRLPRCGDLAAVRQQDRMPPSIPSHLADRPSSALQLLQPATPGRPRWPRRRCVKLDWYSARSCSSRTAGKEARLSGQLATDWLASGRHKFRGGSDATGS